MVVKDNNHHCFAYAKNVLLEPDAIGQLDIGDAEHSPPRVVEHSFAVAGPFAGASAPNSCAAP